MSERGSFVTEYIYCEKCLEAAKKALLDDEKHLCSRQLASLESDREFLPIISGKLGGFSAGEELDVILHALRDAVRPCHAIRIAVVTEGNGVWVIEWGQKDARIGGVRKVEC